MKKLLANLSVRQRITISIVIVAAGAGLYSLVQWKKEADFKPLFTGLAPEDAAGIVQKLKEGGVDYRLPEGGGAVLVPSSRLADLRLSMAAAGLPKTGRIGFELFDKVNLGATEFTEHINYRRALEGELERTIMALAEVDQARVHLTFSKESVFLESQQPAKASVLVRLKPGARLAAQKVLAIDHLVASAVEGLAPDAVTVLDMNGNLLSRPRPAGGLDGPEPSAAALDYRRQVEADMLAKINSTLGPILGAEKFRAGVSVDCDFTGGELSEEIFDPARSVMLSSQRTEDATGAALSGGVPGAASTLPRPTSRPTNGLGKATRVTENVTYQSSRTVKKTRLPAGVVRKTSVAVLVDQEVTWQHDAGGYRRVLVPPSPEKLKVIRDLVAGVTGYSQDRGDQLTIETLPFETTLMLEPPAPPRPATPVSVPPSGAIPGLAIKTDRKTLIYVACAITAVVIALVILRRRRRPAVTEVSAPAALPGAAQDLPTAALASQPNVEHQIESQLAQRDALQQKMDAQALTSLKLAPVITKKAEVFAKHLRDKISKEPEISVQILKSWIREGEE
ncbi:MAG TPA: flagellar basal-body MS-ring/collar protein FliF [Candidatus Acidoferrales bacterium]|nr:flagellar basal-body MS-ring/collar protein FliF [Candidatus Acidoferrales bacterium]